MTAEIVDGGALVQLVWVSLVAATVLTCAMSVAIRGFARAGQERREGRAGAAGLYVAMAVAGAGVVAAAVVFGVAILLHKG